MPEESNKALTGPEISRAIFGGVLEYDGAGHYPGLELLNLVYGTGTETLLPDEDEIHIRRRAHDFARKLVWSEDVFEEHPLKDEVLYDRFSGEALRRLLECLQLEIPSTKQRPNWERAHFFPYTQSLVHWDARERTKRIIIERRYLRGGGALAHRILRKDPDGPRLQRIRTGFQGLYEITKESALEQLAAVLASKGYSDPEDRTDEIELHSTVFNDDLEEIYRQGTERILAHTDLASVVRIRSIIRWTAFWLVLAQHVRAARKLALDDSYLITDCASSYPQLRRASQRCLKEKQALILEAVDMTVEERHGTLPKQRRNSIRSFFWASAATVGLLNAWRGRRHFTLGIEMIETLVMASTSPGSAITFEKFLHDHLFKSYRLVIGRTSAEKADLLGTIDGSVFEDNENHLARQMSAAGFLTEYSDATRMVGIGGAL
jgi:hypothetical protein